jgi:hypothetical protein
MSQRQKGQKVYKSFQGKQIDMDLLRKKNELTPAVGNARVNARGDELGAGGKIIKKREDLVREYYKGSEPVAEEPTQAAKPVETQTAPAATKKSTRKTTRAQQKVETTAEPTTDLSDTEKEMFDEWVEDDDGNFTKKDS